MAIPIVPRHAPIQTSLRADNKSFLDASVFLVNRFTGGRFRMAATIEAEGACMPLPRKANKSGAGLSDAGGIRRTERDPSVRRVALKRFSEGEDMRAPHAEGKKFPEGCAPGAVSPVRVPGSGEEPSTASPQRAHERRRTGYLPVCRRRAAPPAGLRVSPRPWQSSGEAGRGLNPLAFFIRRRRHMRRRGAAECRFRDHALAAK